MAFARFSLVVTDAKGRRLQRIGISPGILMLVGSGVLCLVLAGLWGAWQWRQAILAAPQATLLAHSNERLRQSLDGLASPLNNARRLAVDNALTVTHLYGRSGLGVNEAPGATEPLGAETRIDEEPPSIVMQSELALAAAHAVVDRAQRLEIEAASLTEMWRDAERRLNHTPSIRPARTPWMTSSFGVRSDPLLGHWVMHKGLDLGGPVGMLILAPADGTVIWTGLRGGYGQLVVLDHGWGLQTHFAHLSRALVKRGDPVRRGEPIAEMGSSGRSTGPHLHYEVRQDGVPLDPRRFILD